MTNSPATRLHPCPCRNRETGDVALREFFLDSCLIAEYLSVVHGRVAKLPTSRPSFTTTSWSARTFKDLKQHFANTWAFQPSLREAVPTALRSRGVFARVDYG